MALFSRKKKKSVETEKETPKKSPAPKTKSPQKPKHSSSKVLTAEGWNRKLRSTAG